MFPNVHAVGDSHVLHMGGLFHIHHIHDEFLQGATAHNLNEENSSTRSKERLESITASLDPSRDIVLMSFGEVDCRIHIKDEGMAEDTVSRYARVIENVASKGFRVVVCAVIGAVPQDAAERLSQPHRGTLVNAFNKHLGEWCREHGIEFLELPTMNDDGTLIADYTDDGVHLNSKATPLYFEWARGANLGVHLTRAVWCTKGMTHFGRVAAEALGWPLFIDIPVGDDIEVVYIVGMYDLPDYRFTLRATARAKRRIIQWCGADTSFADKEYLPDAYHFSADDAYTKNLIARGITEVEHLMLPIAYQPEVTPLPEIPTVTTYLGANPQKYGSDYIDALMEALPDVRFQNYTLGSYSPEQMHAVMANTTVQLQLGNGNGGCSLREALQAGRTAIGTLDYEGVEPFDPYDFPALIKRVRRALTRTEPDWDTAARWRALNDVDYFVKRVNEVADGE